MTRLVSPVTPQLSSATIRIMRESEFRGLSGSGKQKHVIEAAGMARLPLAALFEDGAADAERVAALLRAMCQHSRPVKPKDLGVIGSDHWRKLCAGVGGRDDTFRYRRIAEEDENGIPYVVEAAFVARPHHAARAEAESPSGNKRRGHACRTNGITIPCVIPWMAVQRDFWEA
jgi:hypothetical protein